MYWYNMWDNIKSYSYYWHLYTMTSKYLKYSLDFEIMSERISLKKNFLKLDNNINSYFDINQDIFTANKDLLPFITQLRKSKLYFGKISLYSYQNWIIFKIFSFSPLKYINVSYSYDMNRKQMWEDKLVPSKKKINLKTVNLFYFLIINIFNNKYKKLDFKKLNCF